MSSQDVVSPVCLSIYIIRFLNCVTKGLPKYKFVVKHTMHDEDVQ